MAKHATARPVSGEIMTSAHRRIQSAAQSAPDDVFDAEFEVVERTPMVERVDARGMPVTSAPLAEGLGSLSGFKPARPRYFATRGGVAFWTLGTVLIAATFWVSGGHSIIMDRVTETAQKSSPAVMLSDVVSRVDFSGAKPVIFVDGHLSNDGLASAPMPSLEIRVADLHGLVTRYKLGTSSRNLGSGEQFAFSSRLDVPKNGVKTVAVTFAE